MKVYIISILPQCAFPNYHTNEGLTISFITSLHDTIRDDYAHKTGWIFGKLPKPSTPFEWVGAWGKTLLSRSSRSCGRRCGWSCKYLKARIHQLIVSKGGLCVCVDSAWLFWAWQTPSSRGWSGALIRMSSSALPFLPSFSLHCSRNWGLHSAQCTSSSYSSQQWLAWVHIEDLVGTHKGRRGKRCFMEMVQLVPRVL